MPDTPSRLREVAWHELFPWLILLRSIRIALMARVFVLGAIGLIAMTLGWMAIGKLFNPVNDDQVIADWRTVANRWVWEESRGFEIVMSARSAAHIFLSAWEGIHEAPVALWLHLTRPFVDLFRAELTPLGFLHLLLCCLWELAVWGLIGGAITRIAALKFTRDEAPGFLAALKHGVSKFLSYSIAPLIALAGASVFSLQLVVLGRLMRVDLFAFIAALIWPFVLLLGLLMAILLIGALVGWPLMWSTVSVEGTDAFDALSRSYAYVFQRPLRLLWYVLFAGLLAALSMFVVKAFAGASIALGDWSVSWGLDQDTMGQVVASGAARDPLFEPYPPETLAPPLDETSARGEPAEDPAEADIEQRGWLERAGRGLIYFWKSLMAALAAGYQAGFLWVSAVGIYLLLRRDIDGAEMDEVYIDQDDDYGLPPLEEDAATGVPEVTPNGAVTPGDEPGKSQPPPAVP